MPSKQSVERSIRSAITQKPYFRYGFFVNLSGYIPQRIDSLLTEV